MTTTQSRCTHTPPHNTPIPTPTIANKARGALTHNTSGHRGSLGAPPLPQVTPGGTLHSSSRGGQDRHRGVQQGGVCKEAGVVEALQGVLTAGALLAA